MRSLIVAMLFDPHKSHAKITGSVHLEMAQLALSYNDRRGALEYINSGLSSVASYPKLQVAADLHTLRSRVERRFRHANV